MLHFNFHNYTIIINRILEIIKQKMSRFFKLLF